MITCSINIIKSESLFVYMYNRYSFTLKLLEQFVWMKIDRDLNYHKSLIISRELWKTKDSCTRSTCLVKNDSMAKVWRSLRKIYVKRTEWKFKIFNKNLHKHINIQIDLDFYIFVCISRKLVTLTCLKKFHNRSN